MKIQPIKPELRNLIEDFLTFEPYQEIFKQLSRSVGCISDNPQQIKNSLFMPNKDGELCFSVEGMEDLLLEYQLFNQLVGKEPYKTLIESYPESLENIVLVSKKILNGEEITEDDFMLIFETDKYDEIRKSELINNVSKS